MDATSHTAASYLPTLSPPRSWPRQAGVMALLALILFASRIPFAAEARSGLYRDSDEVELTCMTADRFLGVANSNQHWPGGTQQILLLPVLLLDFILHSHGRPSPAALALYLQHLYRSPWHALFLAKLLTSVLSSVALAALYPPFLRALRNTWAAAITVLILGCLPLVWTFCSMAVSGSAAFAWSALCIALLLDESTLAFVAAAGISAGLAIGCRTVFIPLLPFALGLIARWSRRRSALLVFCLCFLAGFLIACPYIWDTPVSFAKATIGNYIKHGSPVGLRYALAQFELAVPLWLTIALIFSVVAAAIQAQWLLLLGTIFSILSLVIPAARAPLVNSRYFLTMPLIVFVFSLISLGPPIHRYLYNHTAGARRLCAALLAIGAIIVIALSTRAELSESRATAQDAIPRQQAQAAIRRLARAGDTVIVDEDTWFDLADTASSAACRQLAINSENASAGGKGVVPFAASFGLEPDVIYVFADNFIQKERAFTARMRARAGIQDQTGLNLLIHAPSEFARRIGVLDDQQAIAVFKHGDASLLLLSAPAADLTPAFSFSNSASAYYLYVRSSNSASH